MNSIYEGKDVFLWLPTHAPAHNHGKRHCNARPHISRGFKFLIKRARRQYILGSFPREEPGYEANDSVGHCLNAANVCMKLFFFSRNYCWHLDGYDKLSPFHIYIHGCIDG